MNNGRGPGGRKKRLPRPVLLLALWLVCLVVGLSLGALLASLFLPASWSGLSGYLYFLIAPWKTLNGMYFGRKARTLRKLVAAPIL